jgi:hypothetical protein
MTSEVPPNFIKITHIYGLNNLGTSTRDVERNEVLFLKQGDTMVDLGTFDEVAKKAGPGRSTIKGTDNTTFGTLSEDKIKNNLFISQQVVPSLQTIARKAAPPEHIYRLHEYNMPPHNSRRARSRARSKNVRLRRSRSRNSRLRRARYRKALRK